MALVTGFWLYDVFVLAAALFAVTYAYFKYLFQHWRKRGIPSPLEPSFPSGNFAGISRTKGMDLLLADTYFATPNEKYFGCYIFGKPIFVVRDLDLVKSILVKDFGHFHDRGIEVDPKRDPLGAHLFLLNGQAWRNLRIKLTPTFTTGKMKMMFPTLLEVGKHLETILDKATNDEETEIKDILARYTTDVISSVAFGIETNSLKNPDAEFRKMGYELTHPDLKQLILNVLVFTLPRIFKYIPVSFIPKHLSKFFINVVRETMEYRLKNNIERKDFMQLLIQLKTLGYVKDADNPEKDQEVPETQQKFTVELAAAQTFLFFFAGFETSSSTMQFALYELALNPDLQKQVQTEIDATKLKNNGEITYEALQEMDLLDRIVSETLRKYPIASVLIRECNKEYKIPGTEHTILPGDNIWFPLYGYHHDAKYYPDPEKFDPDRFLPEVKESRPHYAYLPFGEGPRNCIGNRFGLMQTKAGLALILSRYTLSPSKKTPIPIVFDPKANLLAPKGDMHVKISKRDPSA